MISPSMRRKVAGAAVLTAALALTACAGQTSSGAGSAIDVGPYQAKIEAAMKSQEAWSGPTDKVTPPKGLKIAVITCLSALHGCASPADSIKEAAESLGWTAQIYDGKGDPVTQAKRIEQAITDHVDGIFTTAIDGTAVSSALAMAKAAGIPVVSTSNATAAGEQGYVFDVSPDLEQMGKGLADWIITDSKGKANFTPYLDKEFQSNISTEDGLQAEMKTCTSCTINPTQNFVATDVGSGLGAATVAYLRANPKVNYLHFSFDPAATDQVPALSQAGFSGKVKATSILGDAPNLNYIKQAQIQGADGGWDNRYMGYAAVDQFIRLKVNGKGWVAPGANARFQYGENTPYVLLTKDNLPSSGDWKASFDYVSKFKELWGLK